jgi:hypothetical protein
MSGNNMGARGQRPAISMTSSLPLYSSSSPDPDRELFEACRDGDLQRVKRLVTPNNVNARDISGRKSTPLHFAAGKFVFI